MNVIMLNVIVLSVEVPQNRGKFCQISQFLQFVQSIYVKTDLFNFSTYHYLITVDQIGRPLLQI